MRITNFILVCGLALFLITGCSRTTTPSAPSVEEPKQVLNTYLEGLRDGDFAKIRQGVSDAVYRSWPTDKKKLEEMFNRQKKSIGTLKNWAFSSNPHFDSVNNQAIIQARITTDQMFYVIDFDMRKQNKWYVFGTKIVTKGPLNGQKKSLPGSVTGDSFDKVMEQLNKKNYHKQSN